MAMVRSGELTQLLQNRLFKYAWYSGYGYANICACVVLSHDVVVGIESACSRSIPLDFATLNWSDDLEVRESCI